MFVCDGCGREFAKERALSMHKRFHCKTSEPVPTEPVPTEPAPAPITEPAPAPVSAPEPPKEKPRLALVPFTQPKTERPHKTANEDKGKDLASVKAGLPQAQLESWLKALFEALSEWDGAGAKGYLSPLEARTLSELLYDPMCAAILRYFQGDVEKAKMTIAVAMLIMGKGRIHAQAIALKAKEAKAKKMLSEGGQDQ